MEKQNSMEGRVALITGASRGIGAAVARHFASLGAHVVLVARTVGALEEVDDEIKKNGNGAATLVPLDLLDIDKIDQLALRIAERFTRLDIMVGNAAMLGGLRPATDIPNEIWDNVIRLNLTANWRLLRACHPLLLASEAGRAIFVTSAAASAGMPFWGAYSASKAGLEAIVKAYASENMKTNIRANLIDPGIIRTSMRAEAYPGEDPKMHPEPEAVVGMFEQLAGYELVNNGQVIRAHQQVF